MRNDQSKKPLNCNSCQRAIDFGHDLITAEKGVSGPRGIVPLGEIKVFCSEQCVSNYFNGILSDDLPEILRRIP